MIIVCPRNNRSCLGMDSRFTTLFLNRQRSDIDDGKGVAWGRRWFDKMKGIGGGQWIEWMAGGNVDQAMTSAQDKIKG